jgi:ankyrin repeat protein
MDVKPRNRALLSALERGDVEEFGELVGGDDSLLRMSTPFGSWLHVAASEGQLRMVKYLIQRGLDVNAYGGTLGGAVLNAAASGGHADVVEFLLSTGANLDVSEPERNPLFGAIYVGNKDIVRLLLEAGIDASIKYSGESMKDMDAVAFAQERGRIDLAEVIRSWRPAHCGDDIDS